MSAHKKAAGPACHTLMVDQETFNLIEVQREKNESKGEAVKRLIRRTR